MAKLPKFSKNTNSQGQSKHTPHSTQNILVIVNYYIHSVRSDRQKKLKNERKT